MLHLNLPWLDLAILTPLIGAIWINRVRDPETAQKQSLYVSGLTLLFTLIVWWQFRSLQSPQGTLNEVSNSLIGGRWFVVDELNAPLLSLGALVYLLTSLATLRTKLRRFSFSWTLVSEFVLMATLSCKPAWGIIALLAVGTVPPCLELQARGKSTRIYTAHMILFVVLLVAGWIIVELDGNGPIHSPWAAGLLIAAVLVRSGTIPFHLWMTDLFENATFGTALLFVTPMMGAFAAIRLVLPLAPDWALRGIGLTSLITAVYAAGMALVQMDARRFFCFLFLSHSSLVLVGLEMVTPIGLTGGLCVWLSVGLAMAGFGLALRSIEARFGRISLADFRGLYEHTPMMAVVFLLSGLASVGFPGTFGFIGTELLVDGAVQIYPFVGTAVVIAATLNGIAVLHAYFRLFTGTRHIASISLRSPPPERYAVLALAFLILGGGVFPQPGIASRYHAAMEIMRSRRVLAPEEIPSQAALERKGEKGDVVTVRS